MPPRKNDAARRSDVSAATFTPIDKSAPGTPSTTAAPAAPKPKVSHKKKVPEPTPGTDAEAGAETAGEKDKSAPKESGAVTIEDLSLPKSIITRLSKGVLPSNTQIQANAVLAMSKSATLFINYLASAANEHTINNGKKTIMPADVFAALEDTEFAFFRERLEAEYNKFNETQTSKRNTYRQKVAAKKASGTAGTDADVSTLSAATAAADTTADSAPRSKKQKPNAPDESEMDVDGDAAEEFHDATDAESDKDAEDDDDEDDENAEEEEDEEGEEEEEDDEQEMHDALEEREDKEEQDEALDDGAESE